jgi:20S proteasome alpha/beta subunit
VTNLADAPSPASHQFWLQEGAGLYTSQTHKVTMQNRLNNLGQNQLEAGYGGCKTYRNRKQRPKVTIAIGLITSNQAGGIGTRPTIFMASDSQTTRGATKSLDAQKISLVQFPEYAVVVAQAGSAELADKTVSIIQEKAKSTSVDNEEVIISTIQNSIREVRNHLKALNKDCGFSADDWKRFWLEDNYFQLLIAFYYDRKPKLFTIDIDWGLAIPSKSNYCAIGSGKTMAEFLIREHIKADPDFSFAFPMAISVVEKTIDNVDGCGRPVWVGMAFPMAESAERQYQEVGRINYEKSMASLVDRKLIDLVAAELSQSESNIAAMHVTRLREIYEKASKKHYDAVMEEVDRQYKEQMDHSDPPTDPLSQQI